MLTMDLKVPRSSRSPDARRCFIAAHASPITLTGMPSFTDRSARSSRPARSFPSARVTRMAAAALGLCLAATACGSSVSVDAAPSGGDAVPEPSTSAPPPMPELPRGGTTIFPQNIVVMYYGSARTPALGVLGEGTPQKAAVRLEKAAAPWGPASGRQVLPAFELITTMAQIDPGKDGDGSEPLTDEEVQAYLDVARKNKMLVVLDFQPGRATFLDQVKMFEKFVVQPDVGIALDPEWKLRKGQRALGQIGSARAAEINEVSAYVSDLVAKNNLPEKILIVHQFQQFQLKDRDKIIDAPGLATIIHIDGFGSRSAKFQTYGLLSSKTPQFVNGFKLFYDEDVKLLTPKRTMAMRPQPELVSYQ